MDKLKSVIIGIFLSTGIFVIILSALVFFDLHLHKKFDRIAGLNYRGYRGDVVGRNKADEIRIGLFGGSVAMGYGVYNKDSIAGFLQKYLNEKIKNKKYTVINLAATGEFDCASFRSVYSQFSYLGPDILIFYFWLDFFSPSSIAISDWPSFLEKIKRRNRPFEKVIWDSIEKNIQEKIKNNDFKLNKDEKSLITKSLSTLIRDRRLFTEDELNRVLDENSRSLLAKRIDNLSEQEIEYLNRLGLEGYYAEVNPKMLYWIDQTSLSWRANDWILKNFNYYFIFPLVIREKYYLLRYGSITKGYREDELFKKLGKFPPKSSEPPKKLHDFVKGLTDKNKVIIFALPPIEKEKQPDWIYRSIYLNIAFSNNPNVIIADLKDAFSYGEFSSYFSDPLHYNEGGNETVAKELLSYIPYQRYEK